MANYRLGAPVDRAKVLALNKEVANLWPAIGNHGSWLRAYLDANGVTQSREGALDYFKRTAACGNKNTEIQVVRIQVKQ